MCVIPPTNKIGGYPYAFFMRVVRDEKGQKRGLMFKLKKESLVFVLDRPKRVNLHTWFVFFTIKAHFFDENKGFLEESVIKPFSYYTTKSNKVKYVVEVPL